MHAEQSELTEFARDVAHRRLTGREPVAELGLVADPDQLRDRVTHLKLRTVESRIDVQQIERVMVSGREDGH